MPKVHFLAPYPKFGRAGNQLPVLHQHRSPYYWWWAYLRSSADYLQCCEQGGIGRLSGLYTNFGDVREDDFHGWWTKDQRGAKLFGERTLDVKFGELISPDQWDPDWSNDQVMIIAVPLRESNRSLKGRFASLLDSRLKRKRGRPAMSSLTSTAQYKLARNYDTRHLEMALIAYHLWHDEQKKPKNIRKTLWEIGVEMKISRSKADDAISKNKGARLLARNYLGAVVKRYITQAEYIIKHAEQGVFPVSTPR
jgi:hypothetical protein